MSVWDKRIEKSCDYLRDTYEKGQLIYRRYLDERDDLTTDNKRANFFYANTNTLKESLFNSLPKPSVERMQRGDFIDDVSRVAATIMQRGLTYEVECAPDFEEAVENAIMDRLVPGMGTVWVVFDMDKDAEGKPVPGTEKIRIDHVYWEDFLYEPCRRWSKCGWAGRRIHLTKKEVEEDYGKEALTKIGEMEASNDTLTPKEINKDKYCVYEIWSKRDKKVYHVYKGLDKPLKEFEDPYKLNGFFPCPKPLMANATPVAFRPRTDYSIAQDQYNQLDVTYARIQLIIEAIKVAGLYDASNTNIARMLSGAENKLIPVENWAMHAEKGGVKGQIDWYPVEQVVMVLRELYSAFEATKQILFEITGMSDIVRGQSNPYETKGAQEIKAQFASVRLGGYQRDVAKFVRGIVRIMGEMLVQLYSDQKLIAIVGQLSPNDMQYVPQAMQVLRNDLMSKYKVNIQANSLTQADWALEKEQRMELVTTVGQMVSQITELAAQVPELKMLGVQLIKFAIAGYKAGTELESWIDDVLDKMLQAQSDPSQQEQKPDPEQQKMEMEMQMKQQDAEMKQQESVSKMEMEERKMQMDLQYKQMEYEFKERMAMLDFQIKQIELQMKQQEANLNLQIKQQTAAIDMQTQQQKSELDMATAEQQAAMGLEQSQQQHEQRMQQSKETAKSKPKGDKQ